MRACGNVVLKPRFFCAAELRAKRLKKKGTGIVSSDQAAVADVFKFVDEGGGAGRAYGSCFACAR